jgi:hypothetical protein
MQEKANAITTTPADKNLGQRLFPNEDITAGYPAELLASCFRPAPALLAPIPL